MDKSYVLKNGKTAFIRKLAVSDTKKLVDYLNIAGGESDNLSFGKNGFYLSYKQEEKFIKKVSSDKMTLFLVAEIDGEIVAQASISGSKNRLAHTAKIGGTVKKEFWNIGLGNLIFSKLIEFAKQTEVLEILSLEVRADNIFAIRIYEKLGFKKICVRKKYMKINGDYYDLVLMDLYLKVKKNTAAKKPASKKIKDRDEPKGHKSKIDLVTEGKKTIKKKSKKADLPTKDGDNSDLVKSAVDKFRESYLSFLKSILNHFKTNVWIDSKKAAQLSGQSHITAVRMLKKLVEYNMIVTDGADKGIRYRLNVALKNKF